MSKAIALTDQELAEALQTVPGWTKTMNKITRTFKFGNFREAMAFLLHVAFISETMDHHAEIYNVYNTVKLELNTHDAGNQVTVRDVRFAAKVNELPMLPKS